MRLRKSSLKTYYLKKREVIKDNEGSSYEGYGDPLPFEADISPAQGRIQAERYGERLAYMLNMVCEIIPFQEGDGVCVYVDADKCPDYRVVSVNRYDMNYHTHMVCELEKIVS